MGSFFLDPLSEAVPQAGGRPLTGRVLGQIFAKLGALGVVHLFQSLDGFDEPFPSPLVLEVAAPQVVEVVTRQHTVPLAHAANVALAP